VEPVRATGCTWIVPLVLPHVLSVATVACLPCESHPVDYLTPAAALSRFLQPAGEQRAARVYLSTGGLGCLSKRTTCAQSFCAGRCMAFSRHNTCTGAPAPLRFVITPTLLSSPAMTPPPLPFATAHHPFPLSVPS
jgi:hypothetical protein